MLKFLLYSYRAWAAKLASEKYLVEGKFDGYKETNYIYNYWKSKANENRKSP